MSKCSTCKRPTAAWMKRLDRLARSLEIYSQQSDDKQQIGYAEGMQDAGRRLREMLDELEH